ncbi:MAG TPA: LamG domain-containing protein [Candidatus Limnocylindria bacterium]|nr:LamG domain-containing protein [Candidatus Limnocylindria bacterium]
MPYKSLLRALFVACTLLAKGTLWSPHAFAEAGSGINEVLSFDGSQPAPAVLEDRLDFRGASLTIEFWARLARLHADAPLILGGTAAKEKGLQIGFRPNGAFTFGFGGDDLSTAANLADSGWHHWACVYEATANTRIIYRDGIPVAADRPATAFSGDLARVEIGFAGQSRFHGRVGEVRLWNLARNCEAIAANLAVGASLTASPGLILRWNAGLIPSSGLPVALPSSGVRLVADEFPRLATLLRTVDQGTAEVVVDNFISSHPEREADGIPASRPGNIRLPLSSSNACGGFNAFEAGFDIILAGRGKSRLANVRRDGPGNGPSAAGSGKAAFNYGEASGKGGHSGSRPAFSVLLVSETESDGRRCQSVQVVSGATLVVERILATGVEPESSVAWRFRAAVSRYGLVSVWVLPLDTVGRPIGDRIVVCEQAPIDWAPKVTWEFGASITEGGGFEKAHFDNVAVIADRIPAPSNRRSNPSLRLLVETPVRGSSPVEGSRGQATSSPALPPGSRELGNIQRTLIGVSSKPQNQRHCPVQG